VQRELGGLADHAAQHQQPDDGEPRRRREAEERVHRRLALDRRLGQAGEAPLAGELRRPERREHGDDADQEEVVTEAGDQERLL